MQGSIEQYACFQYLNMDSIILCICNKNVFLISFTISLQKSLFRGSSTPHDLLDEVVLFIANLAGFLWPNLTKLILKILSQETYLQIKYISFCDPWKFIYRVSGKTVSTLFFVDCSASWSPTVKISDIFDIPHSCSWQNFP